MATAKNAIIKSKATEPANLTDKDMWVQILS